jgi:hypothetical protein
VFDIPHGALPDDPTVAAQPGRVAKASDARLVPGRLHMQGIDKLRRDLLDQGLRRPAGRTDLGGRLDAGEVAGLAAGNGLLPTTPHRQLGHRDSDDHQEHERLDVGPLVDGEPLVRLGEEEVEPDTGERGSQVAGQPVPERRYPDNDHNQHQRNVGVLYPGPQRHQCGRDGERKGNRQANNEPDQLAPGGHGPTVLICRCGPQPLDLGRAKYIRHLDATNGFAGKRRPDPPSTERRKARTMRTTWRQCGLGTPMRPSRQP